MERITQNINEQMKYRDQCFASQIHEIRNPLHSVLGNINLLSDQKQNFNVKQRKLIQNAQASGEILLYLVGNILDAKKIEHGNFQCKEEDVQIRKCIWKVIQTVKQSAIKKKIIFESFVKQTVPMFLSFDQMRMIQIILNLLSNAIKFTQKGFVRISVNWIPDIESIPEKKVIQTPLFILLPKSKHYLQYYSTENEIEDDDETSPERQSMWNLKNAMRKTDRQQSSNSELLGKQDDKKTQTLKVLRFQRFLSVKTQTLKNQQDNEKFYYKYTYEKSGILEITIKDTGIGIKQSDIKKLYKPFSQANQNIQQNFGGTGLGLWITKQLIDQMHGNITTTSQLGFGTSFTLQIPLKVSEKALKMRDIFTPTLPEPQNPLSINPSKTMDTILVRQPTQQDESNQLQVQISQTNILK